MKKGYVIKAIQNPKNAFYVVKVNLDLFLGKKIYGNTAGFRHNILGELTRLKMKKQLSYDNNKLKNPLVAELDINGYAKLGKFYDDSVIESILTKYNKIIEDDAFSTVRTEYKGKIYSRYINMVYKKIPEIANLLTNDIRLIIKGHYRGHFQVHHVLAWRNYHVPPEVVAEKEMFASHWHCDGRDTTRVTLFVNLSDVTDNNGPLHVQSKQRTKELVRKGFGGRHDYNLPNDIVEDPRHVVKLTGPKGTAILCNPQLCLHRADIPGHDQQRDILEIRFKPSNEPLYNDWLNRIDETNIVK